MRPRAAAEAGRGRRLAMEFPEEILERVLGLLTSPQDRSAASLVCRAWYRAESSSRESISVGNCYAIAPARVAQRFPRLRALLLKGKPRFADFNLLPPNWGAHLLPWIRELASASLPLQELRLKRMCVSDSSLHLLATSVPCFRCLVLTNCDGFSTRGLASIARHCRQLEELHLQESMVEDAADCAWLSEFPDCAPTALTALNISCLDGDIDFAALQSLVSRSPSLRSLWLCKRVSLPQLLRLLRCRPPSAAPLAELGTGSFALLAEGGPAGADAATELAAELAGELARLGGRLRSLSGVWEAPPDPSAAAALLSALTPVCPNLTFLNLSYASLDGAELARLISRCPNLLKLWVQDNVGDEGLRAVGRCCVQLRELRVFPSEPSGAGAVSEVGLSAIADGCPHLDSLLYFCARMTNAVMIAAAARWSASLTRFRLCIITPRLPCAATGAPLDAGFAAIARRCARLKRLAVSGLLTDAAFRAIGCHASALQTLSVAFAADGDAAMAAVLTGCRRLRKLEIRDCPFGDAALLAGVDRYEAMRFLWLSGCRATVVGCDELSRALPRLHVELVKESHADEYTLDTVYAYRTLLPAPRDDRPPSVIVIRAGDYFFHQHHHIHNSNVDAPEEALVDDAAASADDGDEPEQQLHNHHQRHQE